VADSAQDRAASILAIRLFGPFEACLHGVPLRRCHSRKEDWLLALLALRHGDSVERTWLAGVLWPDGSGSQALAYLRNTLTDLRRALGPEAHRLRSPTPRTLCLDLTGTEVDVVAFDLCVARGDPASPEAAVAQYRGPLLEACTEEWFFQERAAREEVYPVPGARLGTAKQVWLPLRPDRAPGTGHRSAVARLHAAQPRSGGPR
jgi:DNA-binding SARP family transcriptional activator